MFTEIHPCDVSASRLTPEQVYEWTGEVSGVKVTPHYINATGKVVVVTLPNNVKFEIHPITHTTATSIPRSRFCIREHYEIDGWSVDGVHRYLSSLPPDRIISEDLKAFKEGFYRYYKIGSTTKIEFYVDSLILSSQFTDDTDLYVTTKHICLSIRPIAMTVDHPLSSPMLVEERIRQIIDAKDGTAIVLDLVDNTNEISDRHYYALKRHFVIKARKDPIRASGLYVTVSNSKGGVQQPNQEYHCPLDQMESLFGLYKTKEEAESGGNPKMVKEAELAELRQKNLEAEHKLEEMKREQAVLQAKLAEKKAVREDHYDEKEVIRKDYYHDREYSRKNGNEVLKVVGAVVAGVCGVFLAAFKLFDIWSSKSA